MESLDQVLHWNRPITVRSLTLGQPFGLQLHLLALFGIFEKMSDGAYWNTFTKRKFMHVKGAPKAVSGYSEDSDLPLINLLVDRRV